MRKDKFIKLICLDLCLLIYFCEAKILMNGSEKNITTSVFSGGSVTEAVSYIIKTKADVQQLSNDTNGSVDYSGKYFRLDSDLDYDLVLLVAQMQ